MKKANTEEFIEVQTKDKTTRHFPISFAQYSTLLANYLNSGKGGFCEAPEVEDKVMDKISEYLSHISESGPIEIERPLISDDILISYIVTLSVGQLCDANIRSFNVGLYFDISKA